jgi:hypothetical protein
VEVSREKREAMQPRRFCGEKNNRLWGVTGVGGLAKRSRKECADIPQI